MILRERKRWGRCPSSWRSATAGVVLAGCALLLGPATVRADVEPAGSADDFVDRIGFCTHWGYTDTPYGGAYERVKALLGEIGVRHVRDGWKTRERDLFVSHGIKTTVVFGPSLEPASALMYLKQNRDLIDMIEGPNEVDLFQTSANYRGQGFPEGPRHYMHDLYRALKSDPATVGIPIIAPSVGRADANRRLAPLHDFDYLVMHSYAGGAMPSASLSADINNPMLTAYGLLGAGADLKPFVVTESGYHTALGSDVVLAGAQPGVSERAQAKYLPRHFCFYFNTGIRRTFTYEFVDEFPDYNADERQATNAEACFGVLKRDLTPKPAYGAIKNLIGLLSEKRWNATSRHWETVSGGAPSRPVPHALDFTLTGEVENIRHTLLQKANGDFYLLLWNEVSSFDRAKRADIVNTDAAVYLTLGTRMRTTTLYRPGSSRAAVNTWPGQRFIALVVPDEVLVLRLQPAPIPPHKIALTVAAPRSLHAEARGSTVQLRWAPGRGPQPRLYAVYRMGALVGQTTAPEFHDAGLMPGSGYRYEVAAIDARGLVSPKVAVVARTTNSFPDVTVTAVTLAPAHPKPGEPVTFSATFKNIGSAPTPAGTVHGVAFSVDGVVVSWSDRFTGPLALGSSRTVTANNGPKGSAVWVWTPGPHKVRAMFDDVNRLVESDKSNNDLEINVP